MTVIWKCRAVPRSLSPREVVSAKRLEIGEKGATRDRCKEIGEKCLGSARREVLREN